ncbi:MAG: hypothetical protein HYY37_00325 [Candidatus Aenigmarchaeota archaeon]|nr:hypothetical protein [Candidatus Aenigmarchaeota archaeon]
MNLKLAALKGAMLWALVFFEVSILMFGFGVQVPSTLYYIVHLPLLAAFTAFAAHLYFRKEKRAGAKNGFMLGLLFLLVGIVLDALITVPLFVRDYAFFMRADIMVGFAVVLAAATAVGMRARRGKKKR